ncbi:hypothetical protein LPJ61_004942 [Coemansia biformis]|uniref:Uncharacterized protein n=1 Tax=Coemansia biformis TaxID=1286918 RepID=A0A9W7Y7N6_9FUNG|nr:hypothetical protein LPJ61_004942 [Coemansia biformis]
MTVSNTDTYEFAAQEEFYTEQKHTIDKKMHDAVIRWDKQANPTEDFGSNLMNAAKRDTTRETGNGSRVYTGIVPVVNIDRTNVGNMDVTVTAFPDSICIVGIINSAYILLCD